jgi:hypothetical protein
VALFHERSWSSRVPRRYRRCATSTRARTHRTSGVPITRIPSGNSETTSRSQTTSSRAPAILRMRGVPATGNTGALMVTPLLLLSNMETVAAIGSGRSELKAPVTTSVSHPSTCRQSSRYKRGRMCRFAHQRRGGCTTLEPWRSGTSNETRSMNVLWSSWSSLHVREMVFASRIRSAKTADRPALDRAPTRAAITVGACRRNDAEAHQRLAKFEEQPERVH